MKDWSVTVLDRNCDEIGTVSISRDENRQFTRKRLYDLISVTDGVEDRSLIEYTPVEIWENREARFTDYDETILKGFRAAFPHDDVNRLFSRHRPTEAISSRAYYLILLEAVLMGFEAATDGHTDQAWIQIDV